MVLFERMITAPATDTPAMAPDPVKEMARIVRDVKSNLFFEVLSSV